MSGSKSKIAVILLSALTFSADASAKDFGVKNFDNSKQTLGAVGGAAPQVKKGMPLSAKVIVGTLGTLGSLELIHSMIGGFTDSKLGSYSIGRAIRNRVKKNEQPDLGTKDDGKSNERINEKNIDDIQEDENLNAVLKKFKDAAPSAFDSNENKITDFYKKNINEKYEVGKNINESCKEAVNSIISFMNTPNVENGLKIEFNGSYRFTFKGVKCYITFTVHDEVKIVGFGKIILNTTK